MFNQSRNITTSRQKTRNRISSTKQTWYRKTRSYQVSITFTVMQRVCAGKVGLISCQRIV